MRARTLKQLSDETTGFLKTLLNSMGLFSRRLRENSARDMFLLSEAVLCVILLSVRYQADRRFLPFALRALIIARPARVDMRERNPCLRARFRRLG